MRLALRILYLCESEWDLKLVESELEAEDLTYDMQQVRNGEEFTSALESSEFSAILADLHLAQFNGKQALKIAQELSPYTPFLFIVRDVNEEDIIDSLKRGASDVIFKDRFYRLVPALMQSARKSDEIRARKKAEQELRNSEKLHREVLNGISDAVFVTKSNGDFTYVCPNANIIFDYTAEEIQKMSNISRLLGDDFPGQNGKLTEPQQNIRQVVSTKSGAEKVVFVNLRPVHIQDGRLLFSCRDVTELEMAKQELEVSQERFRILFDTSALGIVIASSDGELLETNPAFQRMLGYTSDELRGKTFADITHPDDLPESNRVHQRLVSRNLTEASLEKRYKRIDGSSFWASTSITVHLGVGNDIKFLFAFIEDITERRAANDEILFQAHMLNSVEQAVIATRPDGTIFYWNDFAEKLYGWERHEVMGRNTVDITPSDMSRQEAERIMALLSSGESWSGEFEVRDKQGRAFPVHVTDTPVFDDSGALTAVIGISHDITKVKQAEAALRSSEEKFRRLFEESIDPIYMTTAEGELLDINPAGVTMLGYESKEALLGKNIHDVLYVDPGDRVTFERKIQEQGHVRDFEITLKRKDGSHIPVLKTGTAVYDEQGNWVTYRGMIRDLSKQKQLERQVVQMQKMEAIGTLAGGIAHDFNNILGAIMGYTEMAVEDIPSDHPSQPDLQEVLDAAHRAKELVKQILMFSRRMGDERKPIQMQPIVKEALRLLRATIPTSIDIKQDISRDCEPVKANPTQIHQILMNLCTNGYHAMRHQPGELHVKLETVSFDSDVATLIGTLPPGRYVRLAVSDTGTGMTQDVIDKIFDPFYTTKDVGEGTGLGLSVVHGIVQDLEGGISVQSELDNGSTFEVYLPVIEEEEEAEKMKAVTMPFGEERILFVDDKEQLANLGKRQLERYGYRVKAETSATAALQKIREHPEQFDLIVTDQNMPDLAGLEFARAILEIRPDMPIILITGFSEMVDEKRLQEAGIRKAMLKPVVAYELAEKIRKVFDKKI